MPRPQPKRRIGVLLNYTRSITITDVNGFSSRQVWLFEKEMKKRNASCGASCASICSKACIGSADPITARESAPDLKFSNHSGLIGWIAEKLNRLWQAFLTWESGLPKAGEKPLFRSNPVIELVRMTATLIIGPALTSWLLLHVPEFHERANPTLTGIVLVFWVYAFLLAWAITVAGARAALTTINHSAVHKTLLPSPKANEIACEIISTILLTQPFALYANDHLGKHHPWKTLCSLDDPDAFVMVNWVGFKPGMKSRSEYWLNFFLQLINPMVHWRFLSGRMRANFAMKEVPLIRRAAAITFHAVVVIAVGVSCWALNSFTPLTIWAVAWLIPITILFTCSVISLQAGLHGWLAARKEGESREKWESRVVWNRHPVSHFPSGFIRRVGWFLELFTTRLFERLFCLPSGLPTHGTHHRSPQDKDWANEKFTSAERVRSGSLKMRGFCGIVPSMNFVFDQLAAMPPLPEAAAEVVDVEFEMALQHALATL